MKARRPAQAGAFYPRSGEALRSEVERCFTHRLGPGALQRVSDGPRKIVAMVCPHAGYMYSGPVAAHAYARLALDGKPDRIVILGPNHTGYGSGISVMKDGVWEMPMGGVDIDSELAERIVRSSRIIDVDEQGHRYEHSIEVQLPFLQYLYGSGLRFVPVCMMMQDLETSREVGDAIAAALVDKGLIIASTDLTHYEPQKSAEKKDMMVIDAITGLDEARLQTVVEAQAVSMCGYGPVMAAVVAAKKLGATKAELLKYATSGDVSGDTSQVVGYASVVLTR